MTTLEIRKVSNGYLVLPTYQNTGHIMDGKDVSVFETFEALTNFLGKTFEVSNAERVEVNAKCDKDSR